MCVRRDETGSETIVAVSSAPGASERAIVRMSGPRAVETAAALFAPLSGPPVEALPGWSVVRGALRVAAFVAPVPALLYLMRAPRSYTREDVVEFHVVGSPPVVSAVLDEILARDVRLARPGEFTERAYLSGRIDLSQAEAVLKLIHARTETEQRLAVGELTGELSRRIGGLTERLVEVLTRVELAIDFSEDDVPAVDARTLAAELADLRDETDALRSSGVSRTVYRELPRVAVVGRTNAGKSSLFNRLLARDVAIVTAIDGTTRDLLEEELDLGDVRLLLVDTAGEPPAPRSKPGATDPTHRAGPDPDDLALERARLERTRADLLLVVIDGARPLTALDMTLLEGCSATAALVVLNKCDLPLDAETERTVRARELVVSVSCTTGSGLERLCDEIREALTHGGVREGGQRFLFNLRQLDALRGASDALARATDAAREDAGFEFTAAEVRTALHRLGDLTSPVEEEVLDRIFSRFCIGK